MTVYQSISIFFAQFLLKCTYLSAFCSLFYSPYFAGKIDRSLHTLLTSNQYRKCISLTVGRNTKEHCNMHEQCTATLFCMSSAEPHVCHVTIMKLESVQEIVEISMNHYCICNAKAIGHTTSLLGNKYANWTTFCVILILFIEIAYQFEMPTLHIQTSYYNKQFLYHLNKLLWTSQTLQSCYSSFRKHCITGKFTCT